MKTVSFWLIQLTNVLGIALIIFYILDIYNPMMKFINNGFTKTLILLIGILILVSNQLVLWRLRPRHRREK